MATLSYQRHSLLNREQHKNNLASELPLRMQEVRQIHEVNYGLLLSSIIIALAIIALAWLVTVNAMKAKGERPLQDIAGSQAATTLNHSR